MALKKSVNTNKTSQTATNNVAEKEVIQGESEVVKEETQVEKEIPAQEEQTPVVEKEAVTEETSASTEIAASETPKVNIAKSEKATGTVADYTKKAAEAGFEGMEVGGFGSFPTIILGNDGKFECDDEDWGDDPFVGQLQNSRPLFLCRQAGVADVA